ENSNLENYKSDVGYCAIGSVKSNIGHLESGAATAGIIKILLQMKYGQLAPTLHAEKPNSLISFSQTPFYLQQTLAKWQRPVLEEAGTGRGKSYPRRAGVSSFGAGGVNTHFLLEEYPVEEFAGSVESNETADGIPHLVVLSAQTQERLKANAGQLAAFLHREVGKTARLIDIAYTLQVGRQAMPERLALAITSIPELEEKLSRFCRGESPIEALYQGSSSTGNLNTGLLLEGKEGEEYLKIIIKEKKYAKLAQLWVSGLEIDWEMLYRDAQIEPRRVPLPTYSFTPERHWLTVKQAGSAMGIHGGSNVSARLHPFIDSNESNFREHCYKRVLTPGDTFLKDHVVSDRMVLPGVVYFEMARAAGELSYPGRYIKYIRNIVWPRPLILSGPRAEVFISLKPRRDHVLGKAETVDEKGARLVHAEWSMSYASGQEANAAPHPCDLEAIKKECTHRLAGVDCYRLLQGIGYRYGESFQVIRELYAGPEQGLARLQLHVEEGCRGVMLHPELMDGALQVITAWLGQVDRIPTHPYIPFTVDEVEILAALTPECYARVTKAAVADHGNSPSTLDRYNVEILDESGRLLVKITGYYPRPFLQAGGAVEKIFYRSHWENVPITVDREERPIGESLLLFSGDNRIDEALAEIPLIRVQPGSTFRQWGDRLFEVNPSQEEDYLKLFQALALQKSQPIRILHMWSCEETGTRENVAGEAVLEKQLSLGMFSLVYLSKALLSQVSGQRIQISYVYTHSDGIPQPAYAAVGGMLQTIHNENPNLVFKTIAVEEKNTAAGLAEILRQELEKPITGVMEIRFHEHQRQVKQYKEFPFTIGQTEESSKRGELLKHGGVYIITGGVGGLGLILARRLAENYRARLVLCDRSPLTLEISARLKEIENAGAEVFYVQTDVTRQEEVGTIIAAARARYRVINGII
ncbi:MAG: polyketide synthase PksN, partial [Acidobacteriota bacterium]|nr:polyketide synthase PksN [Acidobacteriota bacterium]